MQLVGGCKLALDDGGGGAHCRVQSAERVTDTDAGKRVCEQAVPTPTVEAGFGAASQRECAQLGTAGAG
jgi:hypothetical protein